MVGAQAALRTSRFVLPAVFFFQVLSVGHAVVLAACRRLETLLGSAPREKLLEASTKHHVHILSHSTPHG